jgi:hypothetical protein
MHSDSQANRWITADRALYIKLGEGGAWEGQCTRDGKLRVSYRDIPHRLCEGGKWDAVQAQYIKTGQKQKEATRYTNELRHFYESSAETLWITFYSRKLWWAFAGPAITRDASGFKYRETVGSGWSCQDVNGVDLDVARLSSKLTMVAGYRGTICNVKELHYLLAKLNGTELPEVLAAKAARQSYLTTLVPVIQNLTWRDFELLIDLVFTSAGWRRVAVLGKTEKAVDLDLLQPVTGERVIIQVKAAADMSVAKEVAASTAGMRGYDRVYLVTHSFAGPADVKRVDRVEIFDVARLVPLVLDAGLGDWVVSKV